MPFNDAGNPICQRPLSLDQGTLQMLVYSICENRLDLFENAIEHPEIVDQRDQFFNSFSWVFVLLLDSFQTLLLYI